IESSIIEKYKCDDEAGQAYIDTYLIKDIDGSYISDYLYIFYQLNHDQKSWKKFALFTKDQVEHQENDSIRQKYAYLYNKFPEITKKYKSYLEETGFYV
ncbi:MAG: hypothetical protein IIU00_00365, partial [Clostridia bacterium]|nr:hypothetical protein [Clostridia bacterium]